MYKIYLKQAWALLKENKLLSGVSIFGTALAICMIMVIVIVWQMRTANYSPEDYRDRMMYVSDTRASYKENESYNDCYFLASRVVKDCFYPLRSAEKVGMAYHGVQRLAAVADHTVEFKCDVTLRMRRSGISSTFVSSPVSLMARKKYKVASWMLW